MKKLMILGGSGYIVPVIEKAHALGCYVITCDFLPDNVAHKFSDKYLDISIIDKDAVLKAALKEKIDGIISFACDPGVVTAAYVAEKMQLPFQCSYKSACILQNKGQFRKFLAENGFNVPTARFYKKSDKDKCISEFESIFELPVIVKPVDSAGSKGCSKVSKKNDLANAIENALEYSHCDEFIVEKFITFKGYHSSADLFTVDGKIKFASYSDQLFDKQSSNAYVPSWIIWPTTMTDENQKYLTNETQRVFDLLEMKNGIYNVETCVGDDNKPYIMEISPRGGGCRIAELQKLIYGDDLIENEIRSALGMPLLDFKNEVIDDGTWCEMIVHSNSEKQGILKSVLFDETIKKNNIKMAFLNCKEGDLIEPFTGANKSLGDIFIRCNTRFELNDLISNYKKWVKIDLK